LFQGFPETFSEKGENRLNIIFKLQLTMEIQSKIDETDKRIETELGEKWEALSDDEKRTMIEKINQEVDYKWDSRFWPQVTFQALPPVLRNLIKHMLRK
jgi:hypothetical protein